MSLATATALLRQVRGLVAAQAADAAPDADLLERFRAGGDVTAFEALVRRHGPMVLRVCRRVLGDAHDAEDAFQATFLVLAQRAAGVRKGASVASWLHGVAYRVAGKARTRAARARPACAAPAAQGDAADEVSWREVRSVLDAELGRLPEECRAPLVLCYLEGLTQDEAARRLGWNARTLRRRLGQGRRLLRVRLERRGLALSAGLAAVLLTEATAPAALPPPLADAAARAGQGSLPAHVIALARGAAGAGWGKAKLAAVLLLAAGAVTGAVPAARHLLAAKPPGEDRVEAPPAAADRPAEGEARRAGTDRYGDPLPPGALLRLGTVRLRHGLGVYSVAYSPDGRLIASTGGDGAVRLWDAATGRLVREVTRRPQREATFAVFSPDGRLLAVGGPQGDIGRAAPRPMPVSLHEVATGKEVRRLEGHGPKLCAAAFAPDGKLLASVDEDGDVRLWQVSTGEEVRRLKGGGGALAFSPDGKLLAGGGGHTRWGAGPDKPEPGGGDVRVWDVATGRELHQLAKEQRKVTAVAFSGDGKLLASASEDQTVRLWDLANGREQRQFLHAMTGRGAYNGVQAMALARRGNLLATGGADGFIRLWDTATRKELRRLTGHSWWVVSLSLSPNGKALASGGWDGTVRLWDIATGQELLPSTEHQSSLRAHPSPDGSRIVTASFDDTVGVWDPATGRRRLTLRAGGGGISSSALSSDGKLLAAGGKDKVIRVWDLGTGRVVRTLTGHTKGDKDEVAALAFAPDGKLLASAGRPDAVVFWEAATGQEVRRVKQQGVAHLAFAPDAKVLAAGGWDGTARLWDVATGRELRVLHPAGPGRGGVVDAVAFSPDGTLLASAGHEGVISLWDTATGERRLHLTGHNDVVWSVAFSPDGKLLASGGLDMTVRLWEVATGKEVHQLKGHSGWVLSVAFLPDGKSLLSAAQDTTALVWGLSPTAGAPRAKPLTPADLDRLWADLAGEDAPRAHRAGWALAEAPAAAVPFLRQRLRPSAVPNAERLRRLVANLDSDDFATREAATAELTKLGAAAAPALRAALKDNPPAEMRRRAAALLTKVREASSPERLRQGRAVAALERMGTAEARHLLEALAKGAPGDDLAEDARGAIQRLGKQGTR